MEADSTLRRDEKYIHNFNGKPNGKERTGIWEDNI
jgi:hypothetical protein